MKKCLVIALLLVSLFLAGCQQQACKRGHSVPHVTITHDSRGTHVMTSSTYVCDEWYPPTK